MAIHPTAVIDKKAEIDPTVEIGPYVIIEGPVRVGANTKIYAHAYLSGWTTIGEGCEIHPFAVVGHLPQDFHFSGERSYCTVGNRVVMREGVTIHRGTQPESSTIIGDECFLMVYAHVGHNCVLSKACAIHNNVALAGHVTVNERAIVAAHALVHQFVRIGKLAFVAPNSRITMDVPPFFMAFGESSIVHHNVVGMQRAGYSTVEVREIRRSLQILYRSGTGFRSGVQELASKVQTDAGRDLVEFLQAQTKRGICGASKGHRRRTKAALSEKLSEASDSPAGDNFSEDGNGE